MRLSAPGYLSLGMAFQLNFKKYVFFNTTVLLGDILAIAQHGPAQNYNAIISRTVVAHVLYKIQCPPTHVHVPQCLLSFVVSCQSEYGPVPQVRGGR